jgi:hypothetical protein
MLYGSLGIVDGNFQQGKVDPIICHENTEGEQMYSFLFNLDTGSCGWLTL